MKKKIVLTVVAVLVLLAGVLGAGAWYVINQPLYKPGMVRAAQNLRAPLTPPAQTGDPDYWQVEPDVHLYHFSQGEGRNVLVIHGGPGVPFHAPLNALEPLAGEYRFHYYDQRGCGNSIRPIDTFATENTYENMTTLNEVLGLGVQISDIERIRQ